MICIRRLLMYPSRSSHKIAMTVLRCIKTSSIILPSLTISSRRPQMRGLYRGLSSPMYGVSAINALTFGIQGNVRRLMTDPDSLRSQFTAGMIAGGCQAVVVSPMELVKSQVQVQSCVTGMGTTYFSSPWDCCRQLWARSGFRGVMRGYWITVVREVPAFGLYFGTYEGYIFGMTE